jgi:UDP-3-O-[3-hydroxymyristoyl] glucosamine N-acyltransferase
MPVTLAELARRFGAQLRGVGDTPISGVAALNRAGPEQIAYVSDRAHRQLLNASRAAAVVLRAVDARAYNGNALIVDHPQLCFARIAAFLEHSDGPRSGIHPRALVDAEAQVAATAVVGAAAVIEAGAVLGEDVDIGPGCYVGAGAEIGAGSRLVGHVWIGARCVLGRNCLMQPGVVVGGDGFGYVKDGEHWIKVPQLGRVVIGDDVEIGANSTVDRGALSDTEIGDGVKIDNLVQVAHNVRIGEHTAIAACVGIAGSTTIGKRCAVGGQVGIADHLSIADDVRVLGKSLVASSIAEPGTYSSALAAETAVRWRRHVVRWKRLEQTEQRLRRLEEDVSSFKEEQR